MKNLTFLLLITVLAFSCKKQDENPKSTVTAKFSCLKYSSSKTFITELHYDKDGGYIQASKPTETIKIYISSTSTGTHKSTAFECLYNGKNTMELNNASNSNVTVNHYSKKRMKGTFYIDAKMLSDNNQWIVSGEYDIVIK